MAILGAGSIEAGRAIVLPALGGVPAAAKRAEEFLRLFAEEQSKLLPELEAFLSDPEVAQALRAGVAQAASELSQLSVSVEDRERVLAFLSEVVAAVRSAEPTPEQQQAIQGILASILAQAQAVAAVTVAVPQTVEPVRPAASPSLEQTLAALSRQLRELVASNAERSLAREQIRTFVPAAVPVTHPAAPAASPLLVSPGVPASQPAEAQSPAARAAQILDGMNLLLAQLAGEVEIELPAARPAPVAATAARSAAAPATVGEPRTLPVAEPVRAAAQPLGAAAPRENPAALPVDEGRLVVPAVAARAETEGAARAVRGEPTFDARPESRTERFVPRVDRGFTYSPATAAIAFADRAGAAGEAEAVRATREIVGQVVEQVRDAVQQGITRVTIRLSPPSLGGIVVTLAIEAERVTALFQVQQRLVEDTLRNNIAQLQGALGQQGIRVEQVQFAVRAELTGSGTHGGNAFFNPEGGRQPAPAFAATPAPASAPETPAPGPSIAQVAARRESGRILDMVM